jgi:cytochrome c oxidase assembly protein subunit 15
VADRGGFRRLYLVTTLLIFGQLLMGATMRHQHAGLAIPDFPAAYGRLWPALDADSIARYNQDRIEVNAANPVTGAQIVLQMAHRLAALAILALVACVARRSHHRLEHGHPLAKMSRAWAALVLTQFFLGAATIWTAKSADIATAHVAVGALSLMTGAMLVIIGRRCLVPAEKGKAGATDAWTQQGSRTINAPAQPGPRPGGEVETCPANSMSESGDSGFDLASGLRG